MLWYASGRFDDANVDLAAALELVAESIVQPDGELIAVVDPQPLLQFGCHYMIGKVAAAQEEWDTAIDAGNDAAVLTNVVSLPHYGHAVALLRIDALLMRHRPGDDETVQDIFRKLSERGQSCSVLSWADCAELAGARVAARFRLPDAGSRLRLALDILEERAHAAPLDADLAFERLVTAAVEIDERIVSQRALARANHYKLVRRTSAPYASDRALEAIN
jgi:hypothetical protein